MNKVLLKVMTHVEWNWDEMCISVFISLFETWYYCQFAFIHVYATGDLLFSYSWEYTKICQNPWVWFQPGSDPVSRIW